MTMKKFFRAVIWLSEGMIVGFGAIMPGISGAALCVAFGMYFPIMEIISHPKNSLKKHWKMLAVFFAGAAAGFIGLSGLAGYLMNINSELVTCIFIGFVFGTFPELWHDAGKEGRNKFSYIAMSVGFIIMLTLLAALDNLKSVTVDENIFGYLLCGVLWGLSFIIPGLSSSTLIIFLGLYQPMLTGISGLDMKVIIPLGIGIAASIVLLSKIVNTMYSKYYPVISHSIIGVVAATAVMIFPGCETGFECLLIRLPVIMCGAVISYILTRLCVKLR